MSAILYPKWTMWYLYSVLTWRAMIYLLPDEILKHKVHVLVVSVISSILVGFVKDSGHDLLSFHRTFVFMPFFMAGYFFHQNLIDIRKYAFRPMVSLCVIVSVVTTLIFLNMPLFQILSGSHPYGFYDMNAIQSLASRGVHLLIAVVMSLSVVGLVKDCSYLSAKIGSDSLFFYMTHSFIVKGTRRAFGYLDLEFSLLTMLLMFILNFAIVYCISKISYSHVVLNPINKIIKSKNSKL